MRQTYDQKLKMKVALEAMQGRSLKDITSTYNISTSLVYAWKRKLTEKGIKAFERKQYPLYKNLS